MSVNWSKYATPSESKKLAADPKKNAVIGFNVGEVREIQMDVRHDPKQQNRAHSLILGLNTEKRKKMRLRSELSKIATWMADFG